MNNFCSKILITTPCENSPTTHKQLITTTSLTTILIATILLNSPIANGANSKIEALLKSTNPTLKSQKTANKAPSNTACYNSNNPNLNCPWSLEYTPAPQRFDQPFYGGRGPYSVGYQEFTTTGVTVNTTLNIKAWYPASTASGADASISYSTTLDVFLGPTNGAPEIIYGLGIENAAINTNGPYPLVIFSHGLSLTPSFYSSIV